MKNWAGNQHWNPNNFFQPSTSGEIQEIVRKANNENKIIRVYGSNHSFTAINNTDSIAINLDNYQGLVKINQNIVTVKAGTKLYNLTKLLSENGLAMENMGDVDRQSIAGAISTGTHGTGINFGGISTQVIAIKFVNGVGDEVFCSETENIELFKCLQLSLGSFGIITEITLRCVQDYKLELIKKAEELDYILSNYKQLNKENRNFEFFWLPHTNKVQTKYSNITISVQDKDTFINHLNDVYIENYLFKFMCDITSFFPSSSKFISNLCAKFLSDSKKVKQSKDVYATPRLVRFVEMEYNIPVEAYQDCINDIISYFKKNIPHVNFPIENRFVQKDDIYMSPSYKRDSAYIACHVYKGKKYKKYFNDLEAIFTNYDGRPHWGKLHDKNSTYFAQKYSMFSIFNTNRKAHDPKGIFLNDYLKKVLI